MLGVVQGKAGLRGAVIRNHVVMFGAVQQGDAVLPGSVMQVDADEWSEGRREEAQRGLELWCKKRPPCLNGRSKETQRCFGWR